MSGEIINPLDVINSHTQVIDGSDGWFYVDMDGDKTDEAPYGAEYKVQFEDTNKTEYGWILTKEVLDPEIFIETDEFTIEATIVDWFGDDGYLDISRLLLDMGNDGSIDFSAGRGWFKNGIEKSLNIGREWVYGNYFDIGNEIDTVIYSICTQADNNDYLRDNKGSVDFLNKWLIFNDSTIEQFNSLHGIKSQ